MPNRQTVDAALLSASSVILLVLVFLMTAQSERPAARQSLTREQRSVIRGEAVKKFGQAPRSYAKSLQNTDIRSEPVPFFHSLGWEYVDGFPQKIAVFRTVFWEPRDTNSLRELIETTDLVRGKTVLEIGTGSGLVSLCCLRAGAAQVIATDVNRNAVENARYNASLLGVANRFEARLVPASSPSAFGVFGPDETFDVIVSNPPWENAQPRTIDEYALYDRDFQLLRSILSGARSRLNSGGRLLLAYGCRDAIETLERLATRLELRVQRLDDRVLHDLPEVFIPGMLLEVLPQLGRF